MGIVDAAVAVASSIGEAFAGMGVADAASMGAIDLVGTGLDVTGTGLAGTLGDLGMTDVAVPLAAGAGTAADVAAGVGPLAIDLSGGVGAITDAGSALATAPGVVAGGGVPILGSVAPSTSAALATAPDFAAAGGIAPIDLTGAGGMTGLADASGVSGPLAGGSTLGGTTADFAGPLAGGAGVPDAGAGGISLGTDVVPAAPGAAGGAAADAGTGGLGTTGGIGPINLADAAPTDASGVAAAPGAAAPAAPASSGGGLSGFLGNIPGLSDVSQFLGTSNAQTLLGAGEISMLGKNLVAGSTVPGSSAVSSLANQLDTQAQQLSQYVNTGTLPPGVGAILASTQKQMTDSIKAKYAQLGMAGSTSETQDINNVALTVQAQGATEAMNLLNSGVSMANLSGQLLTSLMNAQVSQNNATTQSIGNLATALAGGGGSKVTVNAPAGSTVSTGS